MASSHLEQLCAEWYEYRGFSVLRNVEGYKEDMDGKHRDVDLIACRTRPESHLVHVETSDQLATEEKNKDKFRAAATGSGHICMADRPCP